MTTIEKTISLYNFKNGGNCIFVFVSFLQETKNMLLVKAFHLKRFSNFGNLNLKSFRTILFFRIIQMENVLKQNTIIFT
ncbi:hypothetical protein MGA3_09845 [Bacillus methanolicus MGA3]|nr:hypothetical protein MGA3_09845 [Bacillus methanolicus MGA3]